MLKSFSSARKKKFSFSKLRSSLTVLFSSSAAISWTLLTALFFIKTIAQTLLCSCCYAISSCLYYKDDMCPSYGLEWYLGGDLRAITLGGVWRICCRTLRFLTFPAWPSFLTWRCVMMNLCTGWKKGCLLLLAFAWLVTDVHDRDFFFFLSVCWSNVQGKEIINILIRYHNFHASIFLTVHGSQSSHIFTCYQFNSSFHSNNFKTKHNPRKHY